MPKIYMSEAVPATFCASKHQGCNLEVKGRIHKDATRTAQVAGIIKCPNRLTSSIKGSTNLLATSGLGYSIEGCLFQLVVSAGQKENNIINQYIKDWVSAQVNGAHLLLVPG